VTDARDALVDGLREAYSASKKFEKVLTAMAGGAKNEKLRSRLFGHRDITRRQIERIEQSFKSLDRKPSGRTSKVADALAHEAPTSDDVAIVLHAIKIEHFELAEYNSLSKLAETAKSHRATSLLRKNGSESENQESELELMLNELEEETSKAAS
jgi:ferritin-like metal-binding protein YciE